MKKSVYDIGDWVFVNYGGQTLLNIGVIIDIDFDGIEPALYRILLQTYHNPVWLHAASIKSAIG
jgi:hypothetical protein